MTQKRIEAEIVAVYPDSHREVRDNVFVAVSKLVRQGLLAEAYAMTPIVDIFLHTLAISRIAVLTADVPFQKVLEIVNMVGRIPGLTITRADLVDNSKWMPRE